VYLIRRKVVARRFQLHGARQSRALDGQPDTHPECDVCPRAPVAEPNPDGKIKDKGCGAPTGGGFFGGAVLTDCF